MRRGCRCAIAHFDGREPSSYLLNPAVSYVPELPLGDADPLDRHALRFTGEHAGTQIYTARMVAPLGAASGPFLVPAGRSAA